MRHIVARQFSILTRQPASSLLICASSRLFAATNGHRHTRAFQISPDRRAVTPYLLADIGEGITECQIITWFVKPGDRVEQFDRICEVQSDKASVEITSRWDGTIKALHYGTDDMAIVGQPLLDIDTDDAEEEESILPPSTNVESHAEQAVMGDMQERSGPEPKTEQAMQAPPKQPALPPVSFAPASASNRSHVTPGVRHLLKSLGLQVDDIQGTGRDGRVLKQDIQRHTEATQSRTDTEKSPASVSSTAHSVNDSAVPLTPTENIMFKTMTRSLTIPHFLYTDSVDVTSLDAIRKRINSSSTRPNLLASKLTLLPFILKALSQAFMQMPKLNSHLDTESDPAKPRILIKASHNFAVAIDTPQGLLVPVVRDVQSHSVSSLAVELERIGSLARDSKLGVKDFTGATFTISNIGSIGGDAVSPIIVSPMLGILGVGRVKAVPAFATNEQGVEVVIKKQELVLSWSADHRVLDGATVAKCADIVKRLLEDVDILAAILK